MSTNAKDVFQEENIPQASWMKWEEVGQVCFGTLVNVYDKEGDGVMPSQKVFELTQAERWAAEVSWKTLSMVQTEEVWDLNVWIKESNKYILNKLSKAKEGDIIGFAFMALIEPKKKGYNPAKSIEVFKKWVNEEYLAEKNTISVWDAEVAFDDSNFE